MEEKWRIAVCEFNDSKFFIYENRVAKDSTDLHGFDISHQASLNGEYMH